MATRGSLSRQFPCRDMSCVFPTYTSEMARGIRRQFVPHYSEEPRSDIQENQGHTYNPSFDMSDSLSRDATIRPAETRTMAHLRIFQQTMFPNPKGTRALHTKNSYRTPPKSIHSTSSLREEGNLHHALPTAFPDFWESLSPLQSLESEKEISSHHESHTFKNGHSAIHTRSFIFVHNCGHKA